MFKYINWDTYTQIEERHSCISEEGRLKAQRQQAVVETEFARKTRMESERYFAKVDVDQLSFSGNETDVEVTPF